MWNWSWTDHLWRDLRETAGAMRKSPGFALIVVTILALGTGANTKLPKGVLHYLQVKWSRPSAMR